MSKRIFRTFKIFVIESLFLMLMLHFFIQPISKHEPFIFYFSILPVSQTVKENILCIMKTLNAYRTYVFLVSFSQYGAGSGLSSSSPHTIFCNSYRNLVYNALLCAKLWMDLFCTLNKQVLADGQSDL